ncbi:uncharacterized protein LOC121424686 [Lytechinus variegatus]|uniref:uncharacterized protein LOC121424686 n=1 Tax=Lytechinus variegatus TaxID=7654 RepID=UPI001BB0E1D3|nr:uncharacterized protein LOC121424686 [Lytechinus variegatus]
MQPSFDACISFSLLFLTGLTLPDDDLHLPAGSDIGLSVRQMFHYERQIEELRDENHTLSARVADLAEREKNVKKVHDQYAELQNECEDTKEELDCAVMRLHSYDGSCPMPRSHPHGEDMSDHVSDSSSLSSSSYNSHPDYDYHQGREPSRAGPYYRRSRDEGGIRDGRRDGRRYRNVRGR